MRITKVYSNKDSFRTVVLNVCGPSFIIARQKDPDVTKKGQTYNGVGKSLLIRIIHFCFGAKAVSFRSFCERLPGWEFYVDFLVDGNKYTVKRATDSPKKILLNGEELSIEKFNNRMGSICFYIPEDVSHLSFRSLFSFFIRPSRESYVNYNQVMKVEKQYQTLLYNSFLLGLDTLLIQQKRDIKLEQDRIKTVESNFKKDSLLKDFFTGDKDAALTLIDLEEQISNLNTHLKNFKVADDYHEIQKEADQIEKEMFALNNEVILMENNISNIDESLNIAPSMSKKDIETVYNEASLYFPEHTSRTLRDLEIFYEKLIANRKRRLLEQKNKLMIEVRKKKEAAQELKDKLDNLMRYLGEHQALDLFVSLSNKSAELEAKRDSLKKYQDLQAEYKNKIRQADKSQLELTETTEDYLKSMEPNISKLRDYFRTLAKRFYPDSVAGLTIDNNEGNNQLRFNIEAKIESDTSDGINNVKIFCYDLTLLFKGHNHKINLLLHDSRLFDGIDERQKTELFRIVNERFAKTDKQYIATVNQNQIEEIRKYLTESEFENIIAKNTVLTLTDESPKEKLLGIQVDITEG